jgi:hypothetical protein
MDTTPPTHRNKVESLVNEAPLGLTRTAAHLYTWNDGRAIYSPLPSVTTIIKVIDKSGPLVGWAKRETAACAVRNLDALIAMREAGGDAAATDWLKRIPDYQRDSAADVGTRVHKLVEQLALGVEPVVTAEEAPFVDGYRRFLADYRPHFLAVEEMVCSLRHGYAGTLDAVAVIGGETWVLDVKTGSGVYAETGLQLAAYASCDFIGRPGTPRRFRLPRATRHGVVHVRPEGARLVEFKVDRGTFAAFLEARRLFDWVNGPGKAVVGAVVTASGRREAA